MWMKRSDLKEFDLVHINAVHSDHMTQSLNSTEETGPCDSAHSLALTQRVLHAVAAILLIVVDEGEGQVDV